MAGENTAGMSARRIGLALGPLAFALTAFTAPPAGMPQEAWLVAGLVVWMASWWMTEAVPLTVTALLPFLVLTSYMLRVATVANRTAGAGPFVLQT